MNLTNQLITLKDSKWFERQLIAGKAVSNVLTHCVKMIEDGIPNLSLRDLEYEAIKILGDHGCTATFLGYKPKGMVEFPSAICTSVNEVLVHGVVSDYVLKDGDKISIDLGATYEGAIADAAYTTIYGGLDGPMRDMLFMCQKALTEAIRAVRVGNRIGAIGNAIYKTVRDSGFGNVTQFGGHGLDYDKPHASPFVANKDFSKNGIRIVPGLTIAIEPMLTMGNSSTFLGDDGWSVYSKSIGCHFEHTLFVSDNETIVITEHGMEI